jgi:hypothetical protein
LRCQNDVTVAIGAKGISGALSNLTLFLPYGPLPSPHPPRKAAGFRRSAGLAGARRRHRDRRIYEQHAPASPEQAWFWSITVPLDMRAKVVTSGRAPTLDQAKSEFLDNWSAWRAWLAR